MFKWLIGWSLCIAPCVLISAQEPGCGEAAAMARISRAKSTASLTAERQKAGDSYRAQVVFAARWFELHPKQKRSAIHLLNLIPQNHEQQSVWLTFGDSLCSAEDLNDMESLARLGTNLPRDLARAVLIVPDKLPSYIAYALISVQDPHSDYAVQMQTVCRAKHPEFEKAVGDLPPPQKDSFMKHVFDPGGCRALTLPEADE